MLPAVTRVTLLPKHSQVIRNLSGDTCVPMLPAVTGVTMLPKHSSVNLQLQRRPCVTCSYRCYHVTQTQFSKFAIAEETFLPPCYLRLPMLPKHSQVNLLFKWMYLCPCVT